MIAFKLYAHLGSMYAIRAISDRASNAVLGSHRQVEGIGELRDLGMITRQ